MSSILLVRALAGVLTLGATSAVAYAHPVAAVQAQQRCLEIGRIYSWTADRSDRSLVIENDSRENFRLDLMGYCPGLSFAQTIALRSPGGTALSCVSPGDVIYFRSAGMIQRCAILRVTPLAHHHRSTPDASTKGSKAG
ncbi:MAG: hypothetical protein KGO02_14215 [Alphaproteobacteria bacterium]|nr:hypothetical protein [Alphaproteobacteria bacterium]